jgi:ABC-type bacteriocin/lantibiotic exporter with double-glycine peptidase domain
MNWKTRILIFGLIVFPVAVFAQNACRNVFTTQGHLFVAQQTDYYCGPAVLQSILKKYNIHIEQSDLARMAQTNTAVGTSPKNMIQVLESLGLAAKDKYIRSADELRSLLGEKVSVIALVESEGEAHWIIIDSPAGSGFKVMDPWKEFNSLNSVTENQLFSTWSTQFEARQYVRFGIIVSRN